MEDHTTIEMEIGGTLMTVKTYYSRWCGRPQYVRAEDLQGEPLELSGVEKEQLMSRIRRIATN